jgi:hypothetical protein
VNEEQKFKRLKMLQRQARELCAHEVCERNEARIRQALQKIRDYYVRQISTVWDADLSAKIDCLNWILGD